MLVEMIADRPALGEVIVAERARLLALASRLVWDREDARDVVQAALERAVRGWSSVRDARAAPAWLRTLVVNQAMSHLRRRKLVRAVGWVLRVDEEVVEGADGHHERAEHLHRLAGALERLSTRQSTAFTLRYLEGLSIDEVAGLMNIDRGTVRVHLQRAVSALRDGGVL